MRAPAELAMSAVPFIDGASFALDTPAGVEAAWGAGARVLAAKGEPTLIVGGDGVGKTTIAQQLVLARIGLGPAHLLGLPVEHDERPVLYLALDRPRQAARSLRRMVTEADRDMLAAKLIVLAGAPDLDLLAPGQLRNLAVEHEAGLVVIDSLKDLAADLSDENTGTAINHAIQSLVAAGIEVVVLHHQRKAQTGNPRPRAISDVYGSRWITAGCGSVLFIDGDPGAEYVELLHLKQPAEPVGPLPLQHDRNRGATEVRVAADLASIITAHGSVTVRLIARLVHGSESEAAQQKARRDLRRAVREGFARELPHDDGEPARWGVVTGGCQGLTGGCRPGVDTGRPIGALSPPVDTDACRGLPDPAAPDPASAEVQTVSSTESTGGERR